MQLHISSPVGRAALASACLCGLLYILIGHEVQYPIKVDEQQDGTPPLNVTMTLYITRKPRTASRKMESIRLKTGFSNVGIHMGVEEQDVNLTQLPLYTRYVLETGRHDLYQVGSPAMVGKYFSHISAWQRMQKGDVFAIFEEDAHFSDTAKHQLALLDRFINSRGITFNILMLGVDRNPEPTGILQTYDIGEGLKLIQCLSACMMRGSRGYIITYEGAKKILKYTNPVEIQIDGLLSLMARYHKDFKLYWTNLDLALGPTVLEQLNDAVSQHHCLKCHFPTSNVYYIGFWVILLVSWILVCFCNSCCCSKDVGAYIKETTVFNAVSFRIASMTGKADSSQASSPLLARPVEGDFEPITEEIEVQ